MFVVTAAAIATLVIAAIAFWLALALRDAPPESAADTFEDPIRDITRSQGTAGILLVVGILGALWSASAYVGAAFEASSCVGAS